MKSGSFNIDRGVGIRAVHGDKQAFAYSDDITRDALDEAALRRAGDRPARAVERGGLHWRHCVARALPAAGPDRDAARRRKGRIAGAGRADGAFARPAGDAGDGVAGRRIRGDPGRAQRRPPRRRRAAAGARVRDRSSSRRTDGASRATAAAAAASTMAISRTRCSTTTPGRRSRRRCSISTRAPAPAGTMTVVLGHGWPGHPAARGDRARARRRLQPQGHQRVLRPRRASASPRRASR